MNSHEIERIAASMNQLRPDWPLQQLKTLLTTKLADRPRRDVAVALAWIACEPSTSNPYRVLEAGPWWRAAGIEGTATKREVLNPAERCGICSNPEQRCRAMWSGDHNFEADFKQKRDGETVRQIVQSIKAEVAPTAPPPEPRTLDDFTNPNVTAARKALADRLVETDEIEEAS